MASSVQRASRSIGIDLPGVELIARAHALAMAPRLRDLPDDHDPAYLHPGRSVLILIRDVALNEAETLAATALVESEADRLRVPIEEVSRVVGSAVADIVAAVPAPGSEDLAERLVTAEASVVWAALADRLDQLRHMHLWSDRSRWRSIHEEVGAIWLPVAERTHERLATRFRHWFRTFSRRLT